MLHSFTRISLLIGAGLLACTTPPTPPPGSPPDGGNLPDPAPQVSVVDHAGAVLHAPPTSVLAGASTLVVGTQAAPLDPRWFGGPEVTDTTTGAWLQGGLAISDLTTGHVRVYQWQDGLPRFHYHDEYDDWGDGTAPIFGLAWIDQDKSFAAATWNRLVKATKGDDGSWTFIHIALRAPGASEDAQLASVLSTAGALYVGSSEGLAVVDPATLAVQRWVSLANVTGGATAVYGLALSAAAGDADADHLGLLLGSAANGKITAAAVMKPADTSVQQLPLPTGSRPISVGGFPGAVVVGLQSTDNKGSLWTYARPANASPSFQEAVNADALGASTWGAILPRKLAYDAVHGKLLVGGILSPGRFTEGAGLVALDAEFGHVNGQAQDVVSSRDPLRPLVAWMVDVLEVDAQGRWYVGGRQLCSEHKLRQIGLWRLETTDKGMKFSRPWISGARDVVPDPSGEATWVAMRDENPGLQCENAWVAQAACRLKSDGSCEVDPAATNVGDSMILGALSAVSIAFGDPAKHVIAIGTRRDALYLRQGDEVSSPQTQMDLGVGLPMTRVAWGSDNDLWIASEMHWDPLPAGDGIDPIKVNDRGPHGLGVMREGGAAKAPSHRYVRVPSDQAADRDVGGLPSNTVWDVLPLDGTRRALAACGVEREDPTWEHNQGEPSPNGVQGGLALVEDKTVTVIPPPAGTTFHEVVALAKIDATTAIALDSAAGVFTVDLAAKTARARLPAAWQAPERGLSLAVDASGRIAVGTTAGLYVFSKKGTMTKVAGSDALGYVWRLRSFADGVFFAGTDAGVVRIALDKATLPASLGPSEPQESQLSIPDPCGGDVGCTCRAGLQDCADGLGCDCPDPSSCSCQPLDPCIIHPGGRGCSCAIGGQACHGRNVTCVCPVDECTCDVDAATCADGACGCSTASDCPTTWACNPSLSVCEPPQDCDAHCSCDTDSHCSLGRHCEHGIVARCVAD